MKEQMKAKKVQKHSVKGIKGITLIALVITVVVLLILAAVSITAVFGDNGLLQMAKEAADKTNEAVGKEQEDISELKNFLENQLVGENGGSTPSPTPTGTGKTKIADLMKKPKEEQVSNKNQDVEDAYGNSVTIPAGFVIVPNGESHVDYTYSGDEVPAVQDGIVIEDAEPDSNGEKNQFVWIPIGEIKNKENDDRETTSTITLGRYTFNVGHYQSSSETYDGTGEKDLKQEANEKTYTTTVTIADVYQELESLEENNQKYGNAKAKSLLDFIKKTKTKSGYYLARYEAVKGKGENPKVKSMASTVDSATSDSQAIIAGMVWSNITQPDASKKSQEMYDNDDNFETDLVNSYAWDTAIVFIQTYSKETSSYSKQTSINKTIGKTGERDGTTDKVCNIYDMASNLREWSTETSAKTDNPCVFRGGGYNTREDCAVYRNLSGFRCRLDPFVPPFTLCKTLITTRSKFYIRKAADF